MANKNKKAASAAQEAAKVAAAPKPEQKAPEVTQEEAQILKMGNVLKNSARMSADSKAIVANLLQKRVIENPNAPEQVVDGASVVIDAMLADVIVTGVAMGEDVFAMIIRKDENKYLALQSMLNAQGITIPAFKTLPAPTAEQLQKAGVNLLPAESVVVAVDKKDVDKKVVEKKKKELKAEASKPSLDPTKIKDENINFYSAYLNVQAKGDKKEEEKVAALSKEEILQKITDIIGPATFVVNGMMYQPCRATNETGVPVSAFCIVKRMFETSKVFNDKMDDEFIAAVKEHSTDSATYVNGGMMYGIRQDNTNYFKPTILEEGGEPVLPEEDAKLIEWLYSADRKRGDMIIIDCASSVKIFYYIDVIPGYQNDIRTDMITEKYNDWYNGLINDPSYSTVVNNGLIDFFT